MKKLLRMSFAAVLLTALLSGVAPSAGQAQYMGHCHWMGLEPECHYSCPPGYLCCNWTWECG